MNWQRWRIATEPITENSPAATIASPQSLVSCSAVHTFSRASNDNQFEFTSGNQTSADFQKVIQAPSMVGPLAAGAYRDQLALGCPAMRKQSAVHSKCLN